MMIKPKGYPDLVKVSYLGGKVLVDYEEGKVHPIGVVNHSAELVIKYLIDEGFIVPEVKEESN
jgi:hypothetical protein